MEKKFALLIFTLLFSSFFSLKAQVGINTVNPDPSSYLDITGTKKGLLLPRLNATDRDALDKLGSVNGPATGLIIYNTSVGALQVNKGTKSGPNWITLDAIPEPVKDMIWYYLPVTPLAMNVETEQRKDLFPIFYNQLVKPFNLPDYKASDVEFVILGYDRTAFSQIKIDDNSTKPTGFKTSLVYKAIPTNVTDTTYVNIGVRIK